MSMPDVPAGNGRHPVTMIALAANDLEAARAFYAKVFGWQTQILAPGIATCLPRMGPAISLRANTPAGFPGTVPFILVPDVTVALASVEAAGGRTERAPWTIPMGGRLARFTDPCGTIYGLADMASGSKDPIPPPFGENPKPAIHTVCSLEMFARDGDEAAGFFGAQFGWGTVQSMPQYMMFNPGAGVGGVFQSHTPGLTAMAYVYVGNAAATLTAIEAAGGKRTAEPMSAPGMGTFGYFTDVNGTHMGLMSP